MFQSCLSHRTAAKSPAGLAGAAAVVPFSSIIHARHDGHEMVHWSTLMASDGGVWQRMWVLDLFIPHWVSSRDVANRYTAFGTGEASMFSTGPWTLTGSLQQDMNLGAFLSARLGLERAAYRNIWELEMYTQPDSSRDEQTAKALQWLSDNRFLWTTEGRGVTPRVSLPEHEDSKTAGHPWDVRAPFVEGQEFATVAQEAAATDAISALATQ